MNIFSVRKLPSCRFFNGHIDRYMARGAGVDFSLEMSFSSDVKCYSINPRHALLSKCLRTIRECVINSTHYRLFVYQQ